MNYAVDIRQYPGGQLVNDVISFEALTPPWIAFSVINPTSQTINLYKDRSPSGTPDYQCPPFSAFTITTGPIHTLGIASVNPNLGLGILANGNIVITFFSDAKEPAIFPLQGNNAPSPNGQQFDIIEKLAGLTQNVPAVGFVDCRQFTWGSVSLFMTTFDTTTSVNLSVGFNWKTLDGVSGFSGKSLSGTPTVLTGSTSYNLFWDFGPATLTNVAAPPANYSGALQPQLSITVTQTTAAPHNVTSLFVSGWFK